MDLPKPEGKLTFFLDGPQIPDDPDNFHPVWSSVNGFWAPYFWVGPSRTVSACRRSVPSPSMVDHLLRLQGDKCRLCSSELVKGTYSNCDVDHIVPLNFGGQTVESNLQVLCICCHRRKTSLESRKICARMTDPCVTLEDGVVYAVTSHVFFDPDSVNLVDPKSCFNAPPGMYRLVY